MPLVEPEPQDFSRKQTEPYRAPQVPSAASTPETAAPSGAFSVTGGSMPVSSAEILLAKWNLRVECLEGEAARAFARESNDLGGAWQNMADGVKECIADLRSEMERANKRQPPSNKVISP